MSPLAFAPSADTARAALSEARRMRSEYLVAVTTGLLTVRDVVDAAALDSGRPLRRILLRQLHLSQEGWGDARTSRLLSGLGARIDLRDGEVGDWTIAWLLDPRAGGRRYLAWLDVQQEKTVEPWTGFPFAPAPKGIA